MCVCVCVCVSNLSDNDHILSLLDKSNIRLIHSGFSTADAEHGDVTDSEYYSFSPRLTDLKIYDLWDYINQNKANGVEYLYNEYQVYRNIEKASSPPRQPCNHNKEMVYTSHELSNKSFSCKLLSECI